MSLLRKAHSKPLSFALAVLTAAPSLVAFWPSGAAAQSQGSCTVNRATYRVGANCANTTSTEFVNIPQGLQDVTVGGANPTCVIAVFSAQTQTTDDENMVVRAFIPGIGVAVPDNTAFGPGTGTAEARAAQFVFEDVPPGDYSVRIQYRSVTGSNVTLCEPTLVVHHR
jgi:hypothetical protein